MRKIVNVVALWILLATAIFVRDFPWSTQKVASVVVSEAAPELPISPPKAAPGRFYLPEFDEFPELAKDFQMQRILSGDKADAMDADPTIIGAKLVRTYSYSYQFTHNPPKLVSPLAPRKLRMPYADK